jgi:hypothetical protein
MHARGGKAKETHEAHEHEVEHEAGLKHGGRAHKHGGKVHGKHHKGRFARGGKVGADKHPFSSAFTASTEAK